MTKADHIAWWLNDAQRSWRTAEILHREEDSVSALFFFHLTIEKLLKARWIKDNIDNTPKRTHDLKSIYNETDLELPNGWYDYLATVTSWNIEGRYPDYKLKLHSHATAAYMTYHYEKICALKALLESASFAA